MKKAITIFLLVLGYSLTAQTVDYNTNRKGFVAKGYDVVAYFSNKAIEGDDKYTATFDEVNYKFSSKENLDTFNQNPEKFIPQYGGYCAYAIGANSEKVSINPETFEIRDGKLYLFYNAWGTNTLKLWLEESPDELRKAADANWTKLN